MIVRQSPPTDSQRPERSERNSASMHAHVGDRVVDAVRQRDLAAHRAREGLALQLVLVALRQRLGDDARTVQRRAVVDEDPGRRSLRRVDRDRQFDPALAAAELEALVRGDLRRHGEVEAPAVAEIDQRAGQAVGPEHRVAVDQRDAARRLGAEEEASGDDRRSSRCRRGRRRRCRPCCGRWRGRRCCSRRTSAPRAALPMRPALHQLARAQPLRMEAHHERLGDQHLAGRRAQLQRLGRGQRDRLLAQHVLARGRGLQRQRHVQVVGQRVVDRLDLGIGEQGFVRSRTPSGCPARRRLARARAASREAMPRISTSGLFLMPGSTRSRPIFAVLSTPQITLLHAAFPGLPPTRPCEFRTQPSILPRHLRTVAGAGRRRH